MKSRISRLSSLIKKSGAFYVSSPSDVFYLSGFCGTFARIIAHKKRSFFITDSRYKGEVKKLGLERDFDIVITKSLRDDTKKILSKTDTVMMGSSTSLVDYLFIKETKKTQVSGMISDMRMIKDAGEIRLIKKAVSINEAGILHIASIIRPGVTEKDLSLEFEYYVRTHGADSLSFDPIIAFGPASAVPHHKTSNAKLKKNTLILMDCGVKYKGYCSDLTRCISFGIMHTLFKDVEKRYNMVKSAKQAGFGEYKSGAFVRLADAKARFSLKKQGNLDKLFTHSLGHGIGIDIHEPPAVNAKDKGRFRPGMVLSCEPGIYMEGRYGIRIEDDYLITEKGPKKLGKLSDALIIID